MEIERKYLVIREDYRSLASPEPILQGYLNSDKNRTVRVRINGNTATLTIKSLTVGISKEEFEYEIPVHDASTMLNSICERPIIEKMRYRINHAGKIWEVDEFHGENDGLVVAEVELESESETLDIPDWIGPEVSHDPRYFNSNLLKNPYSRWNM